MKKVNPKFELVTITPEFDFNQLEDGETYDCIIEYKHDGSRVISTRSLRYRKNYSSFDGLNDYETIAEIYLPHTEEKKVIEEQIFTETNVWRLLRQFNNTKISFADMVKELNNMVSVSPPSSQVNKEEEVCNTFGHDWVPSDSGTNNDICRVCSITLKEYNKLASVEVSKPKCKNCNGNGFMDEYPSMCNVCLGKGVEVSKKPLSAKEIFDRNIGINQEHLYKPITNQDVMDCINDALNSVLLPAIEVSDEQIKDEIRSYREENALGLSTLITWDIVALYFARWMRDKLKGGNTK